MELYVNLYVQPLWKHMEGKVKGKIKGNDVSKKLM